MTLTLQPCSPTDPRTRALLAALSEELSRLTGNDGTASFSDEDVQAERSVFLLALDDDEPVGCGGLRALSEDTCEIKRMYARYPGRGIGRSLLEALEQYAAGFGYSQIWLETRQVNRTAVNFYLRQGYCLRENYGKYIDRPEAVCFQKILR